MNAPEVIYDFLNHTSRWMSARDMLDEALMLGLASDTPLDILQRELCRRGLHMMHPGRMVHTEARA